MNELRFSSLKGFISLTAEANDMLNTRLVVDLLVFDTQSFLMSSYTNRSSLKFYCILQIVSDDEIEQLFTVELQLP